MLWANDRNFNEDEFREQRDYVVAEHNDLIKKARHDLTSRELKIMDYVISKIKPEDTNLTVVNTSMYEISNVLNLKRSGRGYSQLAENINSMRKKDIYIYNEQERTVVMTGWFERTKFWETGKIELKINKDFAPYLVQLKSTGNYTQYLLNDTVKLKSKYSILLYKLMREANKTRRKSITILSGSPDDFKTWLGAPKSYSYGRLKENILTPSINELNLKIDDMDIELFQARRGRKIVQIELHNNCFDKYEI